MREAPTTRSESPLLDAVRALAPSIAAHAAEVEEGRRLPPPLLAQLREAGLFRMFVPRAQGGIALELRAGLHALEALARADGEVGWTVMIGSEAPQLFALLPHETFRALYAEGGPDLVLGGGFNAQGEARVVPGGYRVSGRWAFASGSEHCDWLFGNCVVLGEDGRPRSVSAAGVPEMRAMVFHARDAQVLDTWRVLGLRGTGSHDIRVEGLFVPQSHTLDLFGGAPQLPERGYTAPLLQFALHMGAVDALFRAAGGGVARDGAPLQRRFRDMHTLAQHGACTDGWYTGAGAALLGRATGGPLG